MPPTQQQSMSVTDLTGHLKAVVEQTFPAVWVEGEISDLARPRSGHVYFTLKDDHAQIRGVIWRGVASRLKFDLEDGMSVLCQGDVEVYAVRGSYQLVVKKAQPLGVGDLQLALQQLQEKLAKEGLFDPARKRQLPRFPKRIALVTSQTGAAIRDFLESAAQRWSGAEIIVIPAVVQGPTAARSIVAGMVAAHQLPDPPDVLILSRGGGSMEDLWCFNEEPVVRAIAASRIPTVSAVGHEIDVTLSDMVADVRALTPTDAAIRVLPETDSLVRGITSLQHRADQAIRTAVRDRRRQVDSLSSRPILRSPFESVHLRSRRLDDLDAQATRAVRSRLRQASADMRASAAALSALSPLKVLARGYSVTLDTYGQAVGSVREVDSGDRIRTRLGDGIIESTVDSTNQSTEPS